MQLNLKGIIEKRQVEILDPKDDPKIILAKQEKILDCLETRVKNLPDKPLFNFRDKNGNWVIVNASDFKKQVWRIAKGLITQGIENGDRIAIMSATCYEWVCLDFATLLLGATVVPIYETSSAKQIANIFAETEPKLFFVQNEAILATYETIENPPASLKHVFVFENDALAELEVEGKLVSDQKVNELADKVSTDTIATIIYTSGSTGTPKGVQLTHGAFLHTIKAGLYVFPELLDIKCNDGQQPRTLVFLPLAHVFARYLVIAMLTAEVNITLSHNIKKLLTDLREVKPTFMLGVPRIFEKIVNAASQKAGKGVTGLIFRRAFNIAIKYSKAIEEGKQLSKKELAQHKLYDGLVYSKLRAVLGGKVKYCISGSAPLNKLTSHFFRGVGVEILEGYGLTECTAVVMVNRVGRNLIGSIGEPLPGIELKLASDNELLIKSPSAMLGYFKHLEATKEVLKDGWLHTGDLATIAESGHVSLIGRKKNILVTAGGKNISPEILEEEIEKSPIVSHAVVVGDNKPFVAALVTLDYENLPTWLKDRAVEFDKQAIEQAFRSPVVNAEVKSMVYNANKLVSRAESIRKFKIIPQSFSIEDGTLTPVQKISRPKILEKFNKLINELYN